MPGSSYPKYLKTLSVWKTSSQAKKGCNLTHRDTEQANAHLHASNNVEDFEYTSSHDPVISSPGQSKAEHVLEDEQAGERFDGNFP